MATVTAQPFATSVTVRMVIKHEHVSDQNPLGLEDWRGLNFPVLMLYNQLRRGDSIAYKVNPATHWAPLGTYLGGIVTGPRRILFGALSNTFMSCGIEATMTESAAIVGTQVEYSRELYAYLTQENANWWNTAYYNASYPRVYGSRTAGYQSLGSETIRGTFWESTSVGDPSECMGLYIRPHVYTRTHQNQNNVTRLTVIYDGTTVVDVENPLDYLAQVAQPAGYIQYRAPVMSYSADTKKSSIKYISANMLGDVCLTQICDWYRGARLLVSRDRFRSFESHPLVDVGTSGGFVTWAAADYHPDVGWHAYYVMNKRLYYQSLTGAFDLDGTAEDITGYCHPYYSNGSHVQIRIHVGMEESDFTYKWLMYHQGVGPIVYGLLAGTIRATTATWGTNTYIRYVADAHQRQYLRKTQTDWKYIDDYDMQIDIEKNPTMHRWPESYNPMTFLPCFSGHTITTATRIGTTSGCKLRGSDPPYLNIPTGTGLLMDVTLNRAIYAFAMLNELPETELYYFKINPHDGYHYLYYLDNIWESDDCINYTPINRVPHWWNPNA